MSSYKQASGKYLGLSIEAAEQGRFEESRSYAAISQALLACAESVGRVNADLSRQATKAAHDLLARGGSNIDFDKETWYAL